MNTETDTLGEVGVRNLLAMIGEDPFREGLKETPARVVKALKEMTEGYHIDPKEYLKLFEDGACDEMVIVKDIEFTSLCEHHMLPFLGVVHIGYLPSGKILGLSKLGRIVEVYARRLQVQERMTFQIANLIFDAPSVMGSTWGCKGVGVTVEAKHLCMGCRGVRKPDATTITTALRGAFKDDPRTRAEYYSLIKG